MLHSQSYSRVNCNCPTRLTAGSVDSLLGKLRAIFNNIGRSNNSNPVAHTRVKEYIKFVREEQARKAIVPSQAVPLFLLSFLSLKVFLGILFRPALTCPLLSISLLGPPPFLLSISA